MDMLKAFMERLFSVMKIVIFLGANLLVLVIARSLAGVEYAHIVASLVSMVLNYLFVMVIEKNRFSFFAAGEGITNLGQGILCAILTYVPVCILEYGLGNLTGDFKPNTVNLAAAAVSGVGYGLFPALLIYGYVFQMIRNDLGLYVAYPVCPLLYVAYTGVFGKDFIRDMLQRLDFTSSEFFMSFFSVLLIGFIGVMLITAYGDMRSTAVYFVVVGILERVASTIFTLTYRDRPFSDGSEMYIGLFCPIILFFIAMYIVIKVHVDEK
ncbi:MAG: hypothetical protein J6M90_03310 [Oscillospiraceae bacterium]|nr:hypothetical protein [Oscillospiraceae bacterium]